MMMRRAWLVAAGVLAALTWAALQGRSVETPATRAGLPRSLAALEIRAVRDGQVRVIATLASSAAALTGTWDGRDPEQRRAAVGALQRQVLAAHLGRDGDKERRWAPRLIEHFPIMAMTVTRAELAALAADPRIAGLWPDELHAPASDTMLAIIGMISNPPIFPEQGAWSLGADGAGTSIAILDTGVDGTHPILAGKVIDEACFSTTNPADGAVSLCPNGGASQIGPGTSLPCSVFPPATIEGFNGCLHGTKVAGVAAGKNASGSGPLGGVAREAKLLAVQVYSRIDGSTRCALQLPSCLRAYTSDLIAALNYVLSKVGTLPQPLAAVNLSTQAWLYPDPGAAFAEACDTHPLKAVIDSLRAQGVPTIIASGNAGQTTTVSTPACISTAVTVAATSGLPAGGETVEFASNIGPSVDLLSWADGNVSAPLPGGGYSAGAGGTSTAAAEVAGAFAAIKSRVPAATVDQIETALKSTGIPVTDTRPASQLTGAPAGSLTRPRIRVHYATQALLGTLGPILDVLPTSVRMRGPAGGPFAPASIAMTVRNSGGAPLPWSATIDTNPPGPTRFDLSVSSGTIPPFSSIEVTVTPNAAANALSDGAYQDIVRVTSGTQSRPMFIDLSVSSAPINDRLIDAITLSGASGTTTGSNVAATHEPSEVQHAPGTTGNKSVWWKWIAPLAGGQAVITTAGSTFDTILAVYGPNVGVDGGRLIRADDNSGGGTASRVAFTTEPGREYFIVVDGATPADSGAITLSWSHSTNEGTGGLVAAVLPTARAIQLGQTATAFGTLINTGAAATGCYIQQIVQVGPYSGVNAEFSFRAVTPANTIDPAFAVNQPVDIAAGASRNFVVAITPRSGYEGWIVPIVFDCENKLPAVIAPGINTLTLTATINAGPDMIAIALTPSGDGVINIPGTSGTGFMAASAINIGATGAITASTDFGSLGLPPLNAVVTLCETNPASGQCLSPPATTTTRTFATNDVATYTVFVQATGSIPFDPGLARVYLRFRDAGGIERGATSVAVRTQ